MKIEFSRHALDRRGKILQRLFELLPGATSWTILVGMLALAFWKPLSAAVLVIAFDFFWLLRLFYMTIFLVLSYFRLSVERKTDWMARVGGMDRLDAYLEELKGSFAGLDWKTRISLWIHRGEMRALKKTGVMPPRSDEIRHLVLFPVVKEGRDVVEPGIASLSRGNFPPKQILVVIAVEDRAPARIKEEMKELQSRYRGSFFDFLVVVHPDGLPGEARVKGSNVTYAAREAQSYFESQGIPSEHVVVSCFDADTVVSQDYFGCLTYCFMTCPERNRASFQPIPVYHNNIWEAPGFARVLEMGSSFFQLVEATNPDKLVTFSSHSMSFRALIDVGFWPVDMISDDSAIFWKALLHYDGDYRVVPMYATVSMDVVTASSWWKTITHVYKQKRRWAWGVENFPIVMRGFLKAKNMPFHKKLRHGFKLFEAHVAWATWAFLLTVIGWFPALFASREFSSSVLYYSAPRITTTIFNLASLALMTTIVLSLFLLPRKKVRNPLVKRFFFALEWLLIPLIVTFLSALPALDAQTRLMLGQYMDFWVTDKGRRKKPGARPRIGSRS